MTNINKPSKLSKTPDISNIKLHEFDVQTQSFLDFIKLVKSCKEEFIFFLPKESTECDLLLIADYIKNNDVIIPLMVNLKDGKPVHYLNTCYWQPAYNEQPGELNTKIISSSFDAVLYGTIFRTKVLSKIKTDFEILWYQDILKQLHETHKIVLAPKILASCSYPVFSPEQKKLIEKEITLLQTKINTTN